jgi:hypothetical protein
MTSMVLILARNSRWPLTSRPCVSILRRWAFNGLPNFGGVGLSVSKHCCDNAESTKDDKAAFHLSSVMFFTLAELRVINVRGNRDDVVYVSEQGDGLKTTLILFQPSNVCALGATLFRSASRNAEKFRKSKCR